MSKLNSSQNSRTLRLGLALTFSLALLIGLLLAMGAARPPDVALAQGPTIRYVAPAPTGNDNGNDCTNSSTPCATVQYAVDVADPGDEICVATGTYTDVQARTGITQVVYISKTVTVRGGYTTTNWITSYPITQPTTLDAQKQGRVLYITGEISPTIDGLRITGGNATGLGGGPSGDTGGGVYVISATTTFRDNQIFDNKANFGGGLSSYSNADVILTGNVISKNLASQHAAGLYFRDSPGAMLITNTINNNKASGGGSQYYGGALFLYSHNASLIGNTVSGNTTENICAGLCFKNTANATLESNTVISNYAGEAGGGLHLDNSDVALINNVIAYNRAGIFGGSGLYIRNSSAHLLHTTLARNNRSNGSGIGICVTNVGSTSSSVALTNTIFADHSVGITVTAGNTATLNGVLWYSNTINYGGEGYISVTNEYTGDPAFAADGYHLTRASAAIDKAVDARVNDDIDSDPRPQGSGYDLGADEFVYRIYLPVILRNSD
jgi:hypothetical protein